VGKKNKKVYFLLGASFLGLFFLGGLGVEVSLIRYLGFLISFLALAFSDILKRKLEFPPGSKLYFLFLALFLLSFLWSQDVKNSSDFFTLFLSGGFFWVFSYNLRENFREYFDKLVLVLGLIFGGLFLFFQISGKVPIRPGSLYLLSTPAHNHLGDLWSIVLVFVIFSLLKTKNPLHLVVFILGIYFLLVSLSRSAYVALAGGVFYLFYKKGWLGQKKDLFWIFISLAAILFIFAGFLKPTVYSRAYFLQAASGFWHNFWGVGVGNFGEISANPENHLFGLDNYSSLTHNIFFEFLVGMGVLGFSFVWWFLRVVKGFLKTKTEKAIPYQAFFIALAANFFFDTTYVIPTMLWLWFIALGLGQEKS